jgi:branched-chain amino acid transport system ATP-binding protein
VSDGDVIVQVEELSLRFGAVAALSNVSFDVKRGELFAVIGPNGAGKTSLFNVLSCIYTPTSGSVRYLEHDLARLRPHNLAALGIARTFQNLALFPQLSVLDNVLVGRTARMKSGCISAGLSLRSSRREERENREASMNALELVGLAAIAGRPVAVLPYGTRKRVELARAIALEPALLLLDEPVAGMSRAERGEITALVRELHQRLAPSVILVEHDMSVVMSLAERVLVLDFGKPITCGTPAEVQANPEVVRAYLGEPDPEAIPGAADTAPEVEPEEVAP